MPNISWFFDLPSESMTGLAVVIGFILTGELTPDQQNALGNFLFLIGQLLSTNAAQVQYLESKKQPDVQSLCSRIAALESKIGNFYGTR